MTCYRKTEVFKMITPVASLRIESSYGKRNLISEILPNSHFEDLGTGNLSVTVFWYFPEWEAPLYGIKASVDKEIDKLYQVHRREA